MEAVFFVFGLAVLHTLFLRARSGKPPVFSSGLHADPAAWRMKKPYPVLTKTDFFSIMTILSAMKGLAARSGR